MATPTVPGKVRIPILLIVVATIAGLIKARSEVVKAVVPYREAHRVSSQIFVGRSREAPGSALLHRTVMLQ
jgi:hypothetical protein